MKLNQISKFMIFIIVIIVKHENAECACMVVMAGTNDMENKILSCR